MITLFLARNSRTKKAIEEAVPSDLLDQVTITTVLRKDLPAVVHIVVAPPGKGGGPTAYEYMARNFNAQLCHLPEAKEWLHQRVKRALDDDRPLVIADAALASSKQVIA